MPVAEALPFVVEPDLYAREGLTMPQLQPERRALTLAGGILGGR